VEQLTVLIIASFDKEKLGSKDCVKRVFSGSLKLWFLKSKTMVSENLKLTC